MKNRPFVVLCHLPQEWTRFQNSRNLFKQEGGMKRIRLVLVLAIGILAVSMYGNSINSAWAGDAEKAFSPFLGKWEGEWSFTYVNAPATRPCKLSVYLDNGQGYVDYSLGAMQTSGRGNVRNIVSNAEQQNKLKAEVKDIKGAPCLIYTSEKGKQIHWFLKNGQLVSESSSAQNDYKGTLSKVK